MGPGGSPSLCVASSSPIAGRFSSSPLAVWRTSCPRGGTASGAAHVSARQRVSRVARVRPEGPQPPQPDHSLRGRHLLSGSEFLESEGRRKGGMEWGARRSRWLHRLGGARPGEAGPAFVLRAGLKAPYLSARRDRSELLAVVARGGSSGRSLAASQQGRASLGVGVKEHPSPSLGLDGNEWPRINSS